MLNNMLFTRLKDSVCDGNRNKQDGCGVGLVGEVRSSFIS